MTNTTLWLPWITIAAIVLGPVIAIMTSQYLDKVRADKQRKLDVFCTLMRTRSLQISPEHVGALNLVEFEFRDCSRVVSAWKEYLAHLGEELPPIEEKTQYDRAIQKRNTLLTTLIDEMAKVLGIKIAQLEILRGNYVPQGWADAEWEQQLTRRGLIDVLHGKTPIQVRVNQAPSLYPPSPGI